MTQAELQQRFPTFVYESVDVSLTEDTLTVTPHFRSGEFQFAPTLTISTTTKTPVRTLDPALVQSLGFHIGLAEMATYWKATCSPQIVVACGSLNEAQVTFWRELLYHGMGEYFVVNGFDPFAPQITISYTGEPPTFTLPPSQPHASHALIPVGGGKDSVVTLELFAKANLHLSSFVIGQDQAALGIVTAFASQHPLVSQVVVSRSIDPGLLALNEQGYANGHTPFSSVVAFVSYAAAMLFGIDWIALSNERSANEPGMVYKGMPVNHQYTKSYAFESDFRAYITTTYGGSPVYFSFLRPLYELQVGGVFSTLPAYHTVFRSCNVGQKTNTWCGKCSKCLFVGILLSAFLSPEKVQAIFGKDILDEPALADPLASMLDETKGKPFECIGTRYETKLALFASYTKRVAASLPIPTLITPYVNDFESQQISYQEQIRALLKDFDTDHSVPVEVEGILHDAVDHLTI